MHEPSQKVGTSYLSEEQQQQPTTTAVDAQLCKKSPGVLFIYDAKWDCFAHRCPRKEPIKWPIYFVLVGGIFRDKDHDSRQSNRRGNVFGMLVKRGHDHLHNSISDEAKVRRIK